MAETASNTQRCELRALRHVYARGRHGTRASTGRTPPPKDTRRSASWRRFRPQAAKSIWLIAHCRRRSSTIRKYLKDARKGSNSCRRLQFMQNAVCTRHVPTGANMAKAVARSQKAQSDGRGRKRMSAFSRVWLARSRPQRLRKLSSEQRAPHAKKRRASASRSV